MRAPRGRLASASTVLAVLLLTLGPISALGAVPAAHAQSITTISIYTSNGATVCPVFLAGTWNGDTCTVPHQFFVSGLTYLEIGAGVAVVASGSPGYPSIINMGAIYNEGNLTGSSSSSYGISNNGNINNGGILTGSSSGYYGISNAGSISNGGTINANGSVGFYNMGEVSNGGTINGTGSVGGFYNAGSGTIDNGGTLTGSSGNYVIDNNGTINNIATVNVATIKNDYTINDYCGATLTYTSYLGDPPNAISCYTVVFDSGLPSGMSWGVYISWPFGTSHYAGTGESISVQGLGGAITYSYDSPVSNAGIDFGIPYVCQSGCSGTATVSGAVPFSATYSPASLISITTSNGADVCPNYPLYGTWSDNTCTVGWSLPVLSHTTLDVGPGVTLMVDGIPDWAKFGGENNSGIANYGVINNYGTINASVNGLGYYYALGVANYGVINNYGTINASVSEGSWDDSSTSGPAIGIYNNGTIDNGGTMTGTVSGWFGFFDPYIGIDNRGMIDNAGTMTGSILPGSFSYTYSIENDGTIDAYCGASVSGTPFVGNPVVDLCHSTGTVVSPNPSAVAPGDTIAFTATVTDLNASSTTPTGTVGWSDGGAGGTFSDSACTLSLGSCTVTYTSPASQGTVTITAAYQGGSTHVTSSGASTLTVKATPQAATQALIDTVNGMKLPNGITTSLDSKLNATIASMSAGNDKAAVNQLNAFIHEVNAQAGRKITAEQAQTLVYDAKAIISAVSP